MTYLHDSVLQLTAPGGTYMNKVDIADRLSPVPCYRHPPIGCELKGLVVNVATPALLDLDERKL